MKAFTEVDQETVKKEIQDQFNSCLQQINQLNAGAWSEYYSRDEFVSAIVGTDYYATRSAWVDLINNYFSMRERQHVELLEIQITALAPDLAIMTSQEKMELWLKNGENFKAKHFFTMIWKKEQDGWKILHSHESWAGEPAN